MTAQALFHPFLPDENVKWVLGQYSELCVVLYKADITLLYSISVQWEQALTLSLESFSLLACIYCKGFLSWFFFFSKNLD